MMLITARCRADMIAHAEAEAPNESCGLVLGDDYVPCTNTAETPRESFAIDNDVMAAACRSGRLRAVVHSHPEGMDCPSKADMAQQAASDVPWGIVVLSRVHGPSVFFWGDQLDVAPYEGRPFRHGTADCYALVRDWYRRERGIELPVTPRDPDWWDKGQDVIAENILAGSFPGFAELGPDVPLEHGDVLLFQVGAKVVNHTGIYVNNGLVLHHLSRRLSRIDVLGPWKQKFHARTMRMWPVQSIGETEPALASPCGAVKQRLIGGGAPEGRRGRASGEVSMSPTSGSDSSRLGPSPSAPIRGHLPRKTGEEKETGEGHGLGASP
ncbi:MAG: C40 family peptidase [Reyranellaceae bacterium]